MIQGGRSIMLFSVHTFMKSCSFFIVHYIKKGYVRLYWTMKREHGSMHPKKHNWTSNLYVMQCRMLWFHWKPFFCCLFSHYVFTVWDSCWWKKSFCNKIAKVVMKTVGLIIETVTQVSKDSKLNLMFYFRFKQKWCCYG